VRVEVKLVPTKPHSLPSPCCQSCCQSCCPQYSVNYYPQYSVNYYPQYSTNELQDPRSANIRNIFAAGDENIIKLAMLIILLPLVMKLTLR